MKLDEITSLVCVPIVYQKESIGVLVVGKRRPDKPITESDVNLLMGIASHTASIITNSRSFTKIKESEKQYRLLANNVTDVIWVLDLDTLKFSYVSPSVKKMQGFTPEELKQIPLHEILVPDSFKKATEAISNELKIASNEGIDPGRSRILELEEYCKDGSTIWIEVTASFLFDDSMNVVGVLGVTRDISNRKLEEKEKEKLKHELRHAQKMEAIGTLAGGIAHDFNNILSSVLGFTELAMDMDEVQEGTLLHEYLADVLTAGNRAKNLVDQILTMSRHEDQETKPIQIVPLIKETLKMLRATIPKSIEFKSNISTDQLIVKADPTQLQQVFVNLMTNAKQAMLDEQGILEVALHAVDIGQSTKSDNTDIPSGRYVQISVSDTGIGIEKENLEKIFEPYFTTKERGSGTGLGLSVVFGIVDSHNGHIEVKSEPGIRTTFHVYLPLVETKGVDEPLIHSRESLPIGKECILLVDDEPAIVKMLERSLKRLGYKVESRTSSLEALEIFHSSPNRYDLLLTDMTMPKMTGDKLAQKARLLRSDLPVILCTGFSEKINGHKVSLNNLRLLMKPVDKAKMAKTIRELLDEISQSKDG